MWAEILHHLDTPEPNIDSGKKMTEAINTETDRLYSITDSFNVHQMQDLFGDLADKNPIFKGKLDDFKNINSSRLEDMLRMTAEQESGKQCEVDDPLDYFEVREEFSWLENELESIGLDLGLVLNDYKNTLENDLDGLDEDFLAKIKDSIVKRL